MHLIITTKSDEGNIYVHDNPVRNRLVEKQWEYVYSSAKDYQGKKGLVNIEFAF